jgi:D-tagatose-1,6-bisphosphate aldolase subunit GatZ/KbaZ
MGLAKLYEKWPRRPFTLLGVGPMSITVVDASLECAIEHDAPMVFIPSRNQVESVTAAGGYVEGWDSRTFRQHLRRRIDAYRHGGLVFVGRDHGGPWQRDEEWAARTTWDDALASALLSYRQDIEAGFDYLHIDTARDPHLPGAVPLDLAAERAVTVLGAVEAYRRDAGFPELDYEVSLEQANGDTSHLRDFEYFLGTLLERIDRRGLPRPLFVVGNTGTLTKAGLNLGTVDFQVTEQLATLAGRYGVVLKEHNADYLSDEVLARHPQSRIGMANVAPEFGKLETEALLQLAALEEAACRRRGLEPSGYERVLTERVLQSRRWRKWLPADADADTWLHDPELRRTLVACNGHYFFSDESVRLASARLCRSCYELGVCRSPLTFVKKVLDRGVQRYLFAFGLTGMNHDLADLADLAARNGGLARAAV